MDREYNLSYITLDGLVEVHKYRYLYFMIVFIVYILILCSNSVIVYLIWIHQNLHEPMYTFIAALLLNSVVVSTNIYPKLLIDLLSEQQIISYQACLFQYFIFYSSCGSECLLLAVMAYDRYVSICKPLQYAAIMRRRTVNGLLAFAWLLPVCQITGTTAMSANRKICGFSMNVFFCNNSIYKLHCVSSRALTIYGVIILVNVVLLPMLYIIFTYTKIFVITFRSCSEVRKKAAQTCLPHLLVLISFTFLITFDVTLVRVETDITKTARLVMTLQLVLYHPLFNPIIYGLKMKEISKHLKRLICHGKLI